MHECDYVPVVYFYFISFWYNMDNTDKFKAFLSLEMEKEEMI